MKSRHALAHDGVHIVPEVLGNNGPVLAGIALPLVDHLADVGPVVEELVEAALVL